ncbi:RNA-binding protein [Candidatus Woesearchaeota archaeon CG10_big_fil_rev_8_21_14_0_10_37_12]|nr:MAG: RNA-binding protein [Candidatus Woesearchaeota archaeon CG10_big_fil_rev_8_21_14_0_10_37_12]
MKNSFCKVKKQLSKRDIDELNQQIESQFGRASFFGKKDNVMLIEKNSVKLIVKDQPLFFYVNDLLVPTLKFLLTDNFLKKVTVDMGAVKFVANGADVMRPGITMFDEGIRKNECVVVVDETHNKPLAVAQALFSAEEMREKDSGKVLKTVHFVGDKIWLI